MRRPLFWLAVGLICLTVLWRWSEHSARISPKLMAMGRQPAGTGPQTASLARSLPADPESSPKHKHRLTNTTNTLGQLSRSATAILLENALLDTTRPTDLRIPNFLISKGDPGSYIVQSRGSLDETFRRGLTNAGAAITAYIPNNAYLVRASAQVAGQLAADPQTQAVIPYEPYYKLKPSLLDRVLDEQQPGVVSEEPQSSIAKQVPPSQHDYRLRLLLFADARIETLVSLRALNVEVLGETTSPFGPVLDVRCPARDVPRVAGLSGVQELEQWHRLIQTIDLSRIELGIATNTTTSVNYLGLTGTNVLVNVNDSGVDLTHPDLAGRVFVDPSGGGLDTQGHGTHMAGIIAGSGVESLTVSNAPGSILPADNFQFRGLAPAAAIFSIGFDPSSEQHLPESYLLQTAAKTNASISNNSWSYADDNDYDIAAATFDAAVRDARPGTTGSQPLICVVAAGNSGNGADNGQGGDPDSIQSPATAKNVISVGALEHPRFITNQTWSCTNSTDCRTNAPWLGLTDSSIQVAAFSSRGNVGVGIEGAEGRFKPDVVAPGTFVLSTRSTTWDQTAYYSPTNEMFGSSQDTNYFQVLSNLNNSAGPFYRFESGTSVAAAEVSGMLALMQEFFEQRLGLTNSPALMKSLLINGARAVGGQGFCLGTGTNFQGWGLVQLPNSAPGGLTNRNAENSSIFLLDQNPARALATGQSRTLFVSTAPGARNLPLRVTLAWTDPPANPIAGLKLVNDLDLIVTNLDTGDVFFGNDFSNNSQFNQAWNPASAPNLDRVNNVENVFLAPSLSAHYSLTVFAARVNVNAVTAQNGIAQDYALVISSGDGQVPDALTLEDNPVQGSTSAQVDVVTNQFSASAGDYGAVLLHQRAGAASPLLATNTIPVSGSSPGVITIGGLNQWHFYILANTAPFTNAAFLTFPSSPLSADVPGLWQTNNPAADRPEADIDLYVSTDPGLTNLDPAALEAADKSLGRGSSEMIVYSNAPPGVFYIGVKCESQEGAEYGFVAALSELPFAELDSWGNRVLRGFPAPVAIPGSATAEIMCLEPDPIFVRRAVVTNTIVTVAPVDLREVLAHGPASVVLLDHPTNVSSGSFVFDDSGQGDIPGAQPSHGPGSLIDFGGVQGAGPWCLTLSGTNHPCTNDNLWIWLEPQPDMSGPLIATVLPGACRQEFFSVAAAATNVAVTANVISGAGPVSFQVYPVTEPSFSAPTIMLGGMGSTANRSLDNTSIPPLAPGIYTVRLCNHGPDAATVNLLAATTIDSIPPTTLHFISNSPASIADDAVSTSGIWVANSGHIDTVNAGVRMDHPRISDLVLHLVSPAGTRVLLQQNRGGVSTEGMGTEITISNSTSINYSGGPQAVTNILETGQNSGTVYITYDFYTLPDEMTVYYDNSLLLDTGLISDGGSTNLSFGPGASTYVTIVMNQNGNPDTNTAWYYNATSTAIAPLYVTFTEDTNYASIPIKFAPTPFTNANYVAPGPVPTSGIFYLPEESLDKLKGEPAMGRWMLEIEDTRAGAVLPPPVLKSWRLDVTLRDILPMPIGLGSDLPSTNLLGPGQIQWFSVDTPDWISFATNRLLSATAPVNLLFNPSTPPTGTNALDTVLLASSRSGSFVLVTNSTPPLAPGSRYFLAVQNTNSSTVSFAVEVEFDITNVTALLSGIPYAATNFGGMDYYRFVVHSNAARAQFEIIGPTADLTLVARRGPPLPGLTSFDYRSANPGTNDELIVVYDFSAPVPLAPGEWFLAVANTTGGPASYSVMATEFTNSGANPFIGQSIIVNNSFCLTWASLPGVHYYVQAITDLLNTNWTIVSPEITATDYSTTFCFSLPSSFQFFRVGQGLVLSRPPPSISSIRMSGDGVLLRWSGPEGGWYHVQWTPSLSMPVWSSFTNEVVSAGGAFQFLDDGSQSGGFATTRFYRLLQLP